MIKIETGFYAMKMFSHAQLEIYHSDTLTQAKLKVFTEINRVMLQWGAQYTRVAFSITAKSLDDELCYSVTGVFNRNSYRGPEAYSTAAETHLKKAEIISMVKTQKIDFEKIWYFGKIFEECGAKINRCLDYGIRLNINFRKINCLSEASLCEDSTLNYLPKDIIILIQQILFHFLSIDEMLLALSLPCELDVKKL